MGEDMNTGDFKACCALKRPFAHVGPFTCPQCGKTTEPVTREQFRDGLRDIRRMFEPSEVPV